MRKVSGEIVLPSTAPTAVAALVIIELRDVSHQDAPSRVVAEQRLRKVRLTPGASIPFTLDVADVPAPASLSIRAHVSMSGSDSVSAGDLLTTASHPVPLSGEAKALRIQLQSV